MKRAEQDGEYLHDAHVVIAAALAEVAGPGMPTEDWASWVLDALAEKGWHLLTYEDAETMLNAYVLSTVR